MSSGVLSLDEKAIWTLRFLAVDMVEAARSGHPGMPLGAAPIAHLLWHRFLKVNPKDPSWFNRDRFVLSAGHGSALLYALLHLAGYDLPLEELKRFRQWGSQTPGHPEHHRTPGVEATTGPLGQGFGNAVGMALVEKHLAAVFNRPGFPIIDHYTYVLASDGDLMEGVSAEAASLAGHWKLGKLIVLYDENHITIDGPTDLAFTEDVLGRFAAYGWDVQRVADGNDLEAIEQALHHAQEKREKPSLIAVRTHIGYGSPHKQDTAAAHGAPLGAEEVQLMKEKYHWPSEAFWVPDEVRDFYAVVQERGQQSQQQWEQLLETYRQQYPELAAELHRRIDGVLKTGWEAVLPAFTEGSMATRKASGIVLNALADHLPELIGGSADLMDSNNVRLKNSLPFSSNTPEGRSIHFGVREHAMGAIANGIALHGGARPFVATFLVFSDYMRPPIRIAAMDQLPVIFVFTHDSIGLGEDGPTHQPIEHFLSLRAIPNLIVLRPADANETRFAWEVAVQQSGPVALVLTRQSVPVLPLDAFPAMQEGVGKGAYVLRPEHPQNLDLTIVATGSEVHPSLEAAEYLAKRGFGIRVVSMPSWQLFQQQDKHYQESVIPPHVPVLTVEAGRTLGWLSYLRPSVTSIGIDRFGASAPGSVLMEKFGFSASHIAAVAERLLSA